jgi:transcriptional regulator with XRE-family HTH domain
MAEATAQITVTPKELGRHLRSIRRKKGLSLSEVARGAGLSRRELVAYERGKVPIPESDLWVLAGSCGVDVADLVPSTPTMELTAVATTTSIGDTVSQLRRNQEDPGIAPYLHTLHKLQALPPGKRIPAKERELDAIATALGSTPRSIEQKLQEVLHVAPDEAERLRAMILTPPTGRGKARAIAAAPAPEPAPTPAAAAAFATESAALFTAPIAPPAPAEPVQTLPAAPAAFLDQPIDAPIDALQGHNVDVFEELARLPEPLPLSETAVPDLLEPQDPFAALPPLVGVPSATTPEGAVELVDSVAPSALGLAHTSTTDPTAAWSAADAPPIDVAARQGSSTWDLGIPPLVPPSTAPVPEAWDNGGWQPPMPEGGDHAPVGFWEGTDDWTPKDEAPEAPLVEAPFVPAPFDTTELVADELVDDELVVVESTPLLGEDTWAGTTWNSNPWASAITEPVADTDVADTDPSRRDDWPQAPPDLGAWDHEPDPAAVDSGFVVDWGTAEPNAAPQWDAPVEPAVTDAVTDALADTTTDAVEAVEPFAPFTSELTGTDWTPAPALDLIETLEPAGDWSEPSASEPADTLVEPADTLVEPDDTLVELAPLETEPGIELAPISWRADGDELVPTAEPALPTTDFAPDPGDDWTVAGTDWMLGNALPLVEVGHEGGLVMRRADERWALADVIASPDFEVEVDVDFRSGPGLGVLFRASVDAEGRMSGYSFDIDPVYDGGGFLVRQWQSDRELWNPVARVAGDDPTTLYGKLVVHLVVQGERLSARVNGVEVLTVESLETESLERGRDAARGDRVGVQAWSSSDLVIDRVRVAAR